MDVAVHSAGARCRQATKVSNEAVAAVMWAWKCSQNKSRRHVVPEYWEGPIFSDTWGLVRDRRGT
eukprot:6469955-Prorocentrum_lima.AAC.1